MLNEVSLSLGTFPTRALVRAPAESVAKARVASVVCLHGWGDSADSFKRLFAELNDLPAQLVALDLPGFGAAGGLSGGGQLPQFVAFAAAAIEHFGRQGPVLPVGQSLGGRAALMAVAGGLATPVSGVVAVGPAPLKLPGWQKVLVRNGNLAPSLTTMGQVASDIEAIEELVRSHKRTCFHAPDTVPEEVFADFARHLTAERARTHIDRLRQFGAEIERPLDLAGVRSRVELIWGIQDRIAPLSGAEDYLRALADARLTTLDQCGHHAHLERPKEVADVVREAAQRMFTPA